MMVCFCAAVLLLQVCGQERGAARSTPPSQLTPSPGSTGSNQAALHPAAAAAVTVEAVMASNTVTGTDPLRLQPRQQALPQRDSSRWTRGSNASSSGRGTAAGASTAALCKPEHLA
jgi:hypothetical protein